MTRPQQPEQPQYPYQSEGSYVLGAAQQQPNPAPAAAAAPPGQPAAQPPPDAGGHQVAPDAQVTAATTPLPPGTALARGTAQPGTVATATATATATVTRTTLARPAAVPTAVPDTQGPRPGGLYGNRQPFQGEDLPGLSGRLPRLRIGSHVADVAALAQLRIPSAGTGLILGADRERRPVAVRFFRPEPTRVTLVGGVWAAQLVAFRALALGARVVVLTMEPAAWQGLGERATGRGDRMGVLSGEQRITVTGSAQQPITVIYDLGLTGPTNPAPPGPWQTQVTVLRQLDNAGVPPVQECHLAMLQRLGGTEAALAGAALRLSEHSVRLSQVMEDDMLALLGGGADRYVWVAPTEVEHRHLGPPRR